MENNSCYLECSGARERSGLYYTCVNSYLKYDELAYILNNSKSKILITSAEKLSIAKKALQASPGIVKCLVVRAASESDRIVNFVEAASAYPTTPIDDEFLGTPMLYSSGTTGMPKGVLRPLEEASPANPLPLFHFLKDIWQYREDMVYLSPAPLNQSAPQVAVGLALRVGGTAIIMERFDPVDYLNLVGQYQVTHSQLVPTMFSQMLRLPEAVRAKAALSSLEAVVHAAAPCPVPVKEAVIDWWGPIIHEYYGATEAPGFTTINNNEKTREALAEDGSMSTVGDVGYLKDEYLYLTDRSTFIIISGGVNIYPQETENLLITHPKVADATVFGVPNEELGEEVRAVVQVMDGVAADDELEIEPMAFCQENLSRQKCPRFIDFEDELPRLPTGKLYKCLLKDRYWADYQNSIV